jgi:undecaprenyl-diphosphatase
VIAFSFPLLAVPVIVVAASVAASRVVLGLHWLSDVLAGAAAGGLIGAAVWFTLLR